MFYVPHHTSCIARHTLHVTYHTSHVTHHTSHVTQPSLGVGYELGVAGSWFGWLSLFCLLCSKQISDSSSCCTHNLFVLSTIFCDSYWRVHHSSLSFFVEKLKKPVLCLFRTSGGSVCIAMITGNPNLTTKWELGHLSLVTCHMSNVTLVKYMIGFQDIWIWCRGASGGFNRVVFGHNVGCCCCGISISSRVIQHIDGFLSGLSSASKWVRCRRGLPLLLLMLLWRLFRLSWALQRDDKKI